MDFECIKIPFWYQQCTGGKKTLWLCLAHDLMDHGNGLGKNSNWDALPCPAVVRARRSGKPGGLEPKHLLSNQTPITNQNQKIHSDESLTNQPNPSPPILFELADCPPYVFRRASFFCTSQCLRGDKVLMSSCKVNDSNYIRLNGC